MKYANISGEKCGIMGRKGVLRGISVKTSQRQDEMTKEEEDGMMSRRYGGMTRRKGGRMML